MSLVWYFYKFKSFTCQAKCAYSWRVWFLIYLMKRLHLKWKNQQMEHLFFVWTQRLWKPELIFAQVSAPLLPALQGVLSLRLQTWFHRPGSLKWREIDLFWINSTRFGKVNIFLNDFACRLPFLCHARSIVVVNTKVLCVIQEMGGGQGI